MYIVQHYKNSGQAFEDLYDLILGNGIVTSQGTKALYDVGFIIDNPLERTEMPEWRKFSLKYAEREWQWYLSENRSVEEIKKYAPIWDTMHSGDNIVNSNYGWQWNRNSQLQVCIENLKNNPGSRQEWVSIYDGKEKNMYQYDTPCTIGIGFDIVENKLNMSVIMRSNDLVYGFCNDQYAFSKLQEYVSDSLNIPVGTYYHYAHNMHIYPRHFEMKKNFYNK